MAIAYLIVKEFKQMFRNRLLPVLFVVLPLALMNMLPRLATQEIKNMTFTVVDLDHSTSSQRLIQKLNASRYFTLTASKPDYASAMNDIESGVSDFVVIIEKDFEKNQKIGQQPRIEIAANGVNGVKAGLGSGYLTHIIYDFVQEGRPSSPVMPQLSEHAVYNSSLDYKSYMVPAVIAMLIVLLVGFLPALNIVGEKEKGTIEQLNVSPVGRITFILSKLIPYWIVGLFLISISMLAAKGLYGIVPRGSIPTIYLACSIFILVMSSLGLIVSNYSSTLRQAALLMFFFLVICILMSGLLTPIASMPEWAQWITTLNPFRYIIATLRILFIHPDSSLTAVAQELLKLSLFGVIFSIWAIASYKKSN